MKQPTKLKNIKCRCDYCVQPVVDEVFEDLWTDLNDECLSYTDFTDKIIPRMKVFDLIHKAKERLDVKDK